MKKCLYFILYFSMTLAAVLRPVPGNASPPSTIPIIDAHSQVDHNTDIEKVVPLMDKAGVAVTILSTRFKRPSRDVIEYARKNPGRVIPAFKTKTRPFMKGGTGYKKLIQKEEKAHTFGAMAEVILYHAQKGNKAGQAIIAPDSQRAMDLLAIAQKHGWPFIFHIEFASAGSYKKTFMKKMEAVVAGYPNHNFGIIHMGQLKHESVARLLKKHVNLFFIMSHANPVSIKNTKQPWTNMFKGKFLKSSWEKLIIQYPRQFVIGFDNVFPMHWGSPYLEAVTYWRSAMSKLPIDVAHAIAHKNAERLWNIEPLQ